MIYFYIKFYIILKKTQNILSLNQYVNIFKTLYNLNKAISKFSIFKIKMEKELYPKYKLLKIKKEKRYTFYAVTSNL